MKLYNVLESLILESVRVDDLMDAVENRKVCKIYYQGDNIKNPGDRIVQPYVYGVSKAGNDVVRVWQLQGVTDSEIPGWKLLRVDKMSRFEPTEETFNTPMEEYNPNDKDMTKIYKSADF